MSQTIKLRRSAVASNVPTVAQLDLGELAINTNDGKMYIKKDDGVESIIEFVDKDSIDHGNLIGLGDDDHTQYLLASGARSADTLTIRASQPVLRMYIGGDIKAAIATNGAGIFNIFTVPGASANSYTFKANGVFHIDGIGSGANYEDLVVDDDDFPNKKYVDDAGVTDHTLLTNIGLNTHDQIDTHLADATIHFTEGSIDHGSILGLADDDHTQYHNDARALTWLNLQSITELSDVDTTGSPGPAIDDVLRWDGTNWVQSEVREGQLWQHVEADIPAMTGATTIPFDDTVPLITEGTEFVTQDFTLINQYNDADMAFTLTLESSVANKTIVIAVFRDSVCIGAYPISGAASNSAKQFTIRLSDQPGDELTHTYSGRIGITGGAWRVNLTAGGTLGGMIVEGSSFAINEAGDGEPVGSP